MLAALLLPSLLLLAPAAQVPPPPPAPVAATVGAEAPVARPRKLNKDELKRYRAALQEGAKSQRKGDHKRAVAAFGKALALQPDDPRALSEQGWAAFLARDLDLAERATRRAIKAAGHNPRLEAASAYNLGRLLQERADKPGAIEAYKLSLRLRPSRTVREQLATLDPVAAAAADPLAPAAMRGPYASLADFCKTIKDASERTACAAEGPEEELAKPEKPFLEARLLKRGDMLMTCYLAVRLPAGWFIDDLGFCAESGFVEHNVLGLELGDVVPGGSKELVLRTTEQRFEREPVELDDGEMRSATVSAGCEGHLVVCGLRPDGQPTCLGMVFAQGYCEPPPAHWDWELQPVFTPDGQVDVKATGKPNADGKALMGKRPLVFP